MSKELLLIIKKYKFLCIFTFILGLITTFYVYSKNPIEYYATAKFKYINPSGVSKTTKFDKNGIITFEKFEPGEGGIDLPSFNNDSSTKVNFNSENGVYIVTNRSLSSDSSIAQVNNFLDSLIAKNSEFLKERLKYTTSQEEKNKIEDLIKYNENMYYALLDAGVKPQEARRVIPQMGYTQIWGAFQPKQLDNYFKLRLDEHSQWEIRQTAIAMKELIEVK